MSKGSLEVICKIGEHFIDRMTPKYLLFAMATKRDGQKHMEQIIIPMGGRDSECDYIEKFFNEVKDDRDYIKMEKYSDAYEIARAQYEDEIKFRTYDRFMNTWFGYDSTLLDIEAKSFKFSSNVVCKECARKFIYYRDMSQTRMCFCGSITTLYMRCVEMKRAKCLKSMTLHDESTNMCIDPIEIEEGKDYYYTMYSDGKLYIGDDDFSANVPLDSFEIKE